jgi:structural maintenance of chromosome 1
VYKDLTKGKAAPMGGVAYLSLEDNEVRREYSVVAVAFFPCKFSSPGAVRGWYQVSRDSPYEALPAGGEKTVAALALLFAIHRCIVLVPSRAFVADIHPHCPMQLPTQSVLCP